MITKAEILQAVLAKIDEQVASLAKSLSDADAAATDPDSKAESKYDTRSLEMSYLVNGQGKQLTALKEAREKLADFEARAFEITERIRLGALVELTREGEWESYFLLPAGGGISLALADCEVTTLSPESPLFAQLEGLRMGDEVSENVPVTEIS